GELPLHSQCWIKPERGARSILDLTQYNCLGFNGVSSITENRDYTFAALRGHGFSRATKLREHSALAAEVKVDAAPKKFRQLWLVKCSCGPRNQKVLRSCLRTSSGKPLIVHEVVLINGGGDADLRIRSQPVDAHHLARAADANALRQRDLRRQRQREFYGRALVQTGVEVEENAPRTHVLGLRREFHLFAP